MAFDDKTRSRLQKLVSECRSRLAEEFGIQVQQTYGLDPNSGEITPLDRLPHLTDRERHTAQLLRDTLAHYLAGEEDEVRAYLPDVVPYLERVKAKLTGEFNRLASPWDTARTIESQKDFARFILPRTKFSAILFNTRKVYGHLPGGEQIEHLEDQWRRHGDLITRVLYGDQEKLLDFYCK